MSVFKCVQCGYAFKEVKDADSESTLQAENEQLRNDAKYAKPFGEAMFDHKSRRSKKLQNLQKGNK